MRLLIQQQRPQTVQAFITQPTQPRNALDPYDEMVQPRHGENSVLQQRLVPVRIRPTHTAPSHAVVPPPQSTATTEQQVRFNFFFFFFTSFIFIACFLVESIFPGNPGKCNSGTGTVRARRWSNGRG